MALGSPPDRRPEGDDLSEQFLGQLGGEEIFQEPLAADPVRPRLTVRGTQALVSFAPLALSCYAPLVRTLFFAARPFRPRKSVSLAPRVPMSTFSKPSEPTLPRNCRRH